MFSWCISDEIIEETREVLMRERHRKRLRYSEQQVDRFCGLLAIVAERVPGPLPVIRAVPLDPKDDIIIATAVAAHADYLVTGDLRHLLPIREYDGIRILTPREFLGILE